MLYVSALYIREPPSSFPMIVGGGVGLSFQIVTWSCMAKKAAVTPCWPVALPSSFSCTPKNASIRTLLMTA
eukprot:3090473-Rhodomonas_salina.1